MPESEKVGRLIRRAREARGLSQREFAQQIGVSYSLISLIETGANTTIERLEQVCAGLGLRLTMTIESETEPSETLDMSGVPEERRGHLQRLARSLPVLADRQAEMLLNILRLIDPDERA